MTDTDPRLEAVAEALIDNLRARGFDDYAFGEPGHLAHEFIAMYDALRAFDQDNDGSYKDALANALADNDGLWARINTMAPNFTLPDGTTCPGPPEVCVLNRRFVASALCPHCRDLRDQLPRATPIEEIDWSEWMRGGKR